MIDAKVRGLPDLREALRGIVPKLRVRALRNALAAGARIVQREARSKTPVISPAALAVRKGYRKPGTVRDAIIARILPKFELYRSTNYFCIRIHYVEISRVCRRLNE